MDFIKETLRIDPEQEVNRICKMMKESARKFRKQGVILGISGGIDSSVCAALGVKAFGKERVFSIQMPETESEDATDDFAQKLVSKYDLRTTRINLTESLKALGCYSQKNDAIKSVIPEFEDHWKYKIVLPSLLETEQYRVFSIVVEKPNGELITKRLNSEAYLQIVAASNYKQRVRKMHEYFHGDRLNYLVIGTPNLLEYDQGFFVKGGDGSADIKLIAHLYKTQVYQIAEYLEVPSEIINRQPTTDTYSLTQSQEEFYFSLPYDQMDYCLYAKNNSIPSSVVADKLNLTTEQVNRVLKDIDQKRSTTNYLHARPILVEDNK